MATADFRCPLCSGEEAERLAAYKGRSPTFRGRDIVQCRACGFVSAHPMPSEEELAAFYRTYWSGHEHGQPDMALYHAQADARFQFIEEFLPLDRDGLFTVVDVGAGFGLIRDVLRRARGERPLRYDAVEVDPDAVAYLRTETRADHVYRELAESDCRYDLGILSHIIEHVPEPLALLASVRERLAPGGVLFLETPNRDDQFKRRNDPHVLFFSPETVAAVLRRARFEPLRVETCGERIEAILDRDRRKDATPRLLRSLRKAIRGLVRRRGSGPAPTVHRDAAETEVDRTGPGRRWIRAVAVRAEG
jgi:SAM-dependent methyltransferase